MPQFEYVDYARECVDRYTSKSIDVVQESKQAVDCLNCEAHLQIGINAWRFIIKADEAVHWSICRNHIDGNEGERLLELIDSLVIEWLEPCDQVQRWIKHCEVNDYTVDFKDDFIECLKEAKSIVKYDPQQPMPVEIQKLRDEAVREHKDGETVEFV